MSHDPHAPTTPAPTTPAPTVVLVDLGGRSPWSILPALCLGFFVIMVDTTIVNIAVPTLQTAFDATLTTVGWVNSAYLLSFAVLLLVTGRLGDRFGPRPVFVSGLVVFTLSSLACGLSGLAGSIELLVAARAVQGVGAALMTPQTMSMITRVFPRERRGAAMGVWGSVAGLATVAGPLLGGLFVETIGWEWIFYVNIPVGIVALVLAVRTLPTLPTHSRSFDMVGVVLSVVGLFLLVFGIQEGQSFGWGRVIGPVTVWWILGAGAVVTAAFLAWQKRRGPDALLPLTLFTHRTFALANVGGAVASFAMMGIFFPLTLFLQQVLGLSALHAALVNLPGSVLSGIVAPFAGRLADRVPGKWVVAAGFGFLATSVAWVALVVEPGISVWHVYLPMALFGVGTGMLFSPLAALATSGLAPATAGAGAGAFNMNRQVGGVIGSAVIVATLTSRIAVEIPAALARASERLPDDVREVVGSLAPSLSSGLGAAGAFDVPAGVPADVAAQVREVAFGAVHAGFATAVGQTMLLAAGVLTVGLVAALAMEKNPH